MSTRAALARRVIDLIDLTDLDDDHRVDGLDALSARAVEFSVPAVCIWPEFVDRFAVSLAGACRIATVIDFPAGSGDVERSVADSLRALDDGADEIDLVLAYRAVMDGRDDDARGCVEAVAEAVHERGALLKVILETGELVEADLIRHASRLAVAAGADFLKTSTGKTAVSATHAALDAMIDVVLETDRTIGLKPSGGIRTLDDAAGYLELVDRRMGADWVSASTFRFGASGLLTDAAAAL